VGQVARLLATERREGGGVFNFDVGSTSTTATATARAFSTATSAGVAATATATARVATAATAATAAIAAPTLFVPAPLVAPTSGTAGVGGPVPGSVPGGGGAGAGPRGPGPGPGPAAPISLRGRERYCSGGAWVGPAPEWPRPPADATVAGADTSGVLPRHAPIVAHVRRKHASLLAASVGAKRRELESLDAKLGGMLVFLNAGEGETHLSAPVADALLGLCVAAEAGDAQNVNAYLLHISTHYWEEVAYWFPALKRLTRL